MDRTSRLEWTKIILLFSKIHKKSQKRNFYCKSPETPSFSSLPLVVDAQALPAELNSSFVPRSQSNCDITPKLTSLFRSRRHRLGFPDLDDWERNTNQDDSFNISPRRRQESPWRTESNMLDRFFTCSLCSGLCHMTSLPPKMIKQRGLKPGSTKFLQDHRGSLFRVFKQ